MKIIKFVALAILISTLLSGTTYKVPLGSSNKTIGLTVNNNTNTKLVEVNVAHKDLTKFLSISETSHVETIKTEQDTIKYSYTVEQNLQIDKIIALQFDLKGKALQQKVEKTTLLTKAE